MVMLCLCHLIRVTAHRQENCMQKMAGAGGGGGETSSSWNGGIRASVMESLRGCGMVVGHIDKEDLKRKLLIPLYLRQAIVDCIRLKDPFAAVNNPIDYDNNAEQPHHAPEGPLIVFINPRSGGRSGPVLMERLQVLMGQEQVFDLTNVRPHEFVEYGLGCLENMAAAGDTCAKETREKIRVVVAGGDGTVGWVLGCLGQLNGKGRLPVPPIGILPLGTGNDLSRSFGWGGSFPFSWKSAVKGYLSRAMTGPVCRLDSWRILLSIPDDREIEAPHALKMTNECNLDQDLDVEGELPDKVSFYDGVLYNYFSIGMDAQVAYGFHHLRNERPYLAQSPITNKLIYSTYTCRQGWFLTPCKSDPSLRGLKNIVRMHVKKVNSSDWELIQVPKSIRAIVALNLPRYASGRNPWGQLSPEYLEKRGFLEAQPDDGLLEVFGLKQGWHASFVMVELIPAKHIAQAAAIRLEIRGGEWQDAFMQMDGEPWKQPLSKEYSTFVEIKRVPHHSLVVKGE